LRTALSGSPVLKKFDLKYIFKSIRQRAVFSKLITLLLCIAMTVLLIQAGTLFLLDYMISSQRAIEKVNVHKIYWDKHLFYLNSLRPSDAQKTLAQMKKNYLEIEYEYVA